MKITLKIKYGNYGRHCFSPDDSVSKFNGEIIPFSLDIRDLPLPYEPTVDVLKNLKGTFSQEYGGCSLSYSHSDNKISANFRYTTEHEENCGDYTSEGQVNKFKCYCDDGDDDFDFSTRVEISYDLQKIGSEDDINLLPLEEGRGSVSIGVVGYSLGDVITDIGSRIGEEGEEGEFGQGNFKLQISARITDDKCTSGEQSIELTGTILTKSNIPFVEIESKEPRLEVLASILHKVTHIKKVGDAQRILSNALQDMSHMDIVKEVDRTNPDRTQITLELTALDDFDRDRDYILYSVLPKDEVSTSGLVNHERAEFIDEDDNPTNLKYSVRDDDPVIDWHFKYVGNGRIEIVYNVPPGSDGGELILLRDKPFAYNAGNLLFNSRYALVHICRPGGSGARVRLRKMNRYN